MSPAPQRRARLRIRRPDRLMPGLFHGLTAEMRVMESRARKVFTPHRPVLQRDRLYGRDEEILRIVRALNTPGRNVVLRGPAGIGKSSVVNVVAAIMSAATTKPHVLVRCDTSDTFETIVAQPLAAAGVDVLRVESVVQLAETTKADAHLANVGVSSEKLYTTSATYRPDARMGPAEAARHLAGQAGLLIVDETHTVSEAERHKLAVFGKHLGENGSQLKLLATGTTRSVTDLLGPAAAAVAEVCLEPLSDESLRDLVHSGLVQLGLTVDDDVPATVADLCDGYPHFAHLLGLKCAEAVIGVGRTHITAQDLRLAMAAAIEDADNTLTHTYTRAPAPELLALLAGLPTPFTIDHIGRTDVAARLLDWTTGEAPILQQAGSDAYEFSDPRMRCYVRIRHLLI